MEVVIEEKVPVYAAGLGHPGPWMDRLHSNGTRVMAVIGKVKHAQQVVDYGIDMIVAQGHDGGGHTRSEAHTSELQSLMRISYSVFRLKQQTSKSISTHTIHFTYLINVF